jgi:hypothetical protein
VSHAEVAAGYLSPMEVTEGGLSFELLEVTMKSFVYLVII